MKEKKRKRPAQVDKIFNLTGKQSHFRKTKSDSVCLKFKNKINKQLNHKAEALGVSKTQVVEDIIADSLANWSKQNPIEKTKTVMLSQSEYDIIMSHRKKGTQKTLF